MQKSWRYINVCVRLRAQGRSLQFRCEHQYEIVCVVGVRGPVMCVCVCIPLFLNTSHVPPLSRMGQQVSRSLTRTLPVLFWIDWLQRRGCQSPQPFPSHPTALSASVALASLLIQMIWTNTVWCLFITHWLYFSISFCTTSHVLYVNSSVPWPTSAADQPRKLY